MTIIFNFGQHARKGEDVAQDHLNGAAELFQIDPVDWTCVVHGVIAHKPEGLDPLGKIRRNAPGCAKASDLVGQVMTRGLGKLLDRQFEGLSESHGTGARKVILKRERRLGLSKHLLDTFWQVAGDVWKGCFWPHLHDSPPGFERAAQFGNFRGCRGVRRPLQQSAGRSVAAQAARMCIGVDVDVSEGFLRRRDGNDFEAGFLSAMRAFG